jgi:hypothetical protein
VEVGIDDADAELLGVEAHEFVEFLVKDALAGSTFSPF